MYSKSYSEDLSEESEWEQFDKFVDINKKDLRFDNFKVTKSEDNSKFIIYILKSNKVNSIACLVYDKNFNKIWDKEFEIKTSNWLNKPICMLSNDGTFIFSGRYELPSSEKKRGNSKYNDIIYVCNKDGVENYNVAIDNHFVSSLNFIVDDASKKMTIAGFYSDKKTGFYGFDTEGYLVGYFYKKIDLSTKKIEIDVTKKIDDLAIKNEINKSTFPISEDTKNQSVDGAIELPHEKVPNKYEIKKMVKRENGDISMICEYYRYANESRGSFDYTIYYFGPILVVNFNNVGEMIKAFYIPKVQSRKGNQITSFLSSVNNNNLTFVYYDNEKNYGTKGYIGAELPDFPDAVICAVTSDFDGNIIKREVIYKRSKKDKNIPYLLISNAKRINDKRYLIEISRNKSYQYGFLTFE